MKFATLFAFVWAATALTLTVGQAGAVPAMSVVLIQPVVDPSSDIGLARKVHSRNTRHCHGKGAKRRCHGPRRPRGSHSG